MCKRRWRPTSGRRSQRGKRASARRRGRDVDLDILADWLLVEADFHREYGIEQLMNWCTTHSWREFCVRLAGLSPNSALAAHLSARNDKADKAPRILEDPDEVRAAIMEL